MHWPIRRRSIIFFLSILPLALVASGCDGGPSTPSGGSTGGGSGGGAPTVTSVAVTGSTTVARGETAQLQAVATLSDGTTQTVTALATWESSAPNIASISSTGF